METIGPITVETSRHTSISIWASVEPLEPPMSGSLASASYWPDQWSAVRYARFASGSLARDSISDAKVSLNVNVAAG